MLKKSIAAILLLLAARILSGLVAAAVDWLIRLVGR